MKKFILFTIIIMTLITGISVAGATETNRLIVAMNGNKEEVRQVNVLVDGVHLKSEVPSFIHIDRTLVPVRFVAEALGAKVEWEQETRSVIVLNDKSHIKLTIDSPMAKVDEEDLVLDKNSIPRLVVFENEDGRTMVPLAFIAEVLDYEVGYDEEKKLPYINSVKGVEESEESEEFEEESEEFEEESEEEKFKSIISSITIENNTSNSKGILIKADGKLDYKVEEIRGENKYIVDIVGAKLDLKDSQGKYVNLDINHEDIKRVEYSQHSIDPYITRIIIHKGKDKTIDIRENKDGKTYSINLVNKINDIKMELLNGENKIVINSSGSFKYNTMKLENPHRIVLDILDSSFNMGSSFNSNNTNIPGIKGIRAAQFQPDNNYRVTDSITRIVLDVENGVNIEDLEIENINNKIILGMKESLWDYINFDSIGNERLLKISNNKNTNYLVELVNNDRALRITIPKNNIDIKDGTIRIQDGLVGDIESSLSGNNRIILINFMRSVNHELLSKTMDENIIIKLTRNQDLKAEDRLIVIDPGHGGRDPGATSASGLKEKDLAFEMSKKLENQLKDKGYNVLMTRNSDTYIELKDRAKIANDVYADIFISIHANAHTNTSINGIETYYCPRDQGVNKTKDQYPLAKHIQDNMIKETGANDRGVKQNSRFIVIRETNMPAVLLELGFISNQREEANLKNSQYQDKLIRGILTGIDEYFYMQD